MSHQTGATILTLLCHMIEFTKRMKFRREIQMEYIKTPMFHDWNWKGSGAMEMRLAKKQKMESKG